MISVAGPGFDRTMEFAVVPRFGEEVSIRDEGDFRVSRVMHFPLEGSDCRYPDTIAIRIILSPEPVGFPDD